MLGSASATVGRSTPECSIAARPQVQGRVRGRLAEPTRRWTVWIVPLLLSSACKKPEAPEGPPDPYDVQIGPYQVDVRTTSYGIPHILADDIGSAAYGMGWATARDHLCTLADQFVKIRSERARYFGPGEDNRHIDEDFGWLGLGIVAQAEEGFLSLPVDQRDTLVGFTAGYNRYLSEADLDPRCAGAEWLAPITHIDLLAYYLHLGQLASGLNLIREVGNAAPPGLRRATTAPPPPLSILEPFRELPIGSNGWAIGSSRTSNGRGMLLSNTHFPSQGELQWWESHLTVPGVVDVYGVSLIGSAIINMGFNEHLAWTHTVSNTPRFIVYALELDPADSTRYLFDGSYVDMDRETYEIEVLQPDGSRVSQSRVLYRTQWGPVFNAPLAGWSPVAAYSWRDVNAGNLGLLSSFAGMNQATDQASFEASHRDHQGIPWVHTMFADADGTVMYLDSAATPNLSPEAEAAYAAFVEEDTIAGLFADYGLVVVPAEDPVYTWVEDPAAAIPGAVPYDRAPRLVRDDFVSNSNENHWLSNPLEPLTGYPMLYGPTGTPRRPRTKMNNRYLLETDGASGPDHRFSLDELEAAALSARASLAEDLVDQVVERCAGTSTVDVELDGAIHTVDLTEACGILAAWDRRSGLDSRGAHLWREVVGAELNVETDLVDAGRLFADPFDPSDPIYTPSVLSEGPSVMEDLAVAVIRLGEAGQPLDAPLGEIQYALRDGQRYPRIGGHYIEGLISIATYDGTDHTMLPFETQP
ncbi:MAG TPA: acylase, partial [Deltaproteobacteria bacterium]|nr:acylase [Deltaproteobacteria bacterium]